MSPGPYEPASALVAALESLPEPTALVDGERRLVMANVAWKAACGGRSNVDDALPEPLRQCLAGLDASDDDRAQLTRGLDDVIASRSGSYEQRVSWAGEGPRRTTRIELVALDDGGVLVRRFDHEPVTASLERWRGSWAGSLAGVGLWDYDVLTGDLWWSEEVYQIHEIDDRRPMTADEAVGFYSADGRTVLERTVERAIIDGQSWHERLPIVTAKGNRIWVDARGHVDLVDGAPQRIYGTFRDVTDEMLAELKLQASEERLKLVVEGSSDGYWDWNLEDDTVFFSPRYLEQLGYSADEVEPSLALFEELLHPEDAHRLWTAVERHLEYRERFDAEFRMRHSDGSWRWIWSRGQATRDDRGDAIRMTGVHTDVTSAHVAQEALDEARREAEDASRSKSEFLANMSHEIRTPMTAILGFSEILSDPSLDEESRSLHVETIRRNGEHLLAILNDILDISKIEAGRLAVEQIDTSALDAARDVHKLLVGRAEARGLALVLEVATPLPRSFPGDPVRLRQILNNIVGNAVKFTSSGEVRIRLSFDEADSVLAIAVSDEGIGLSPEQLERLFQPFSQADTSTTRRFGGTGLGLAISKRLAEALGGDIAVSSTFGEGSTFTLSIPIAPEYAADRVDFGAPAEQEATRAPLPAPTTAPLDGLQILLAEDGADNQRLISLYLRRAGAEVSIVENGVLAVELVEALAESGQSFDVILMDMQMPELDGYGATTAIRAGGCDAPIIALTAHAMSGDRDRCLEAGCTDYQTKPIDAALLIERCGTFAAEAQARRAESA